MIFFKKSFLEVKICNSLNIFKERDIGIFVILVYLMSLIVVLNLVVVFMMFL